MANGEPLSFTEVLLMQQSTHRLGELQRLEHALLIERGKLEAADDLAQKLMARVSELEANAGKLPKEPPVGLLVSMAQRLDHGLFAPVSIFSSARPPGYVEAAISTMRQLYEEVSGHGFWSPENDCEYVANLEAHRASAADGEKR